MKYSTSFLVGLVTFLAVEKNYAQDTSSTNPKIPFGITFEYGFGNFSVVDEYISDEKYSGYMPYYKIGWSKAHEKYMY